MKILVCFKIEHDLDSVMERDWAEASLETFDISYTQRMINCYDEAALECALRLKDAGGAQGREVQVDAVTVGAGRNDLFYKNMFAVGIQNILQLETRGDLRFCPGRVAQVIAQRAGGYDLILTGRQTSSGGNGSVPFALARLLKLPCVSNVVRLEWAETGLRVKFETDWGFRSGTLAGPAVCAVGNSNSPYLRVATLREKLSVSSKCPQIIPVELPETAAGLGADPVPVALRREKRGRACRMLTGDDLRANMRLLYQQYIKEGRT